MWFLSRDSFSSSRSEHPSRLDMQTPMFMASWLSVQWKGTESEGCITALIVVAVVVVLCSERDGASESCDSLE
jgi:hypothetical protein